MHFGISLYVFEALRLPDRNIIQKLQMSLGRLQRLQHHNTVSILRKDYIKHIKK